MAKYIIQLNPINTDGKAEKMVFRVTTKLEVKKIVRTICFEQSLDKPQFHGTMYGMTYFMTTSHLVEVKKTGRFTN